MYGQVLLPALSLLSLAVAAPLDESWMQPRDSEVAHLFKRAAPDPSADNYTSYYPDAWTTPNSTVIPQAWLDKLNNLTMPNVSVATMSGSRPTYPNHEDDGDDTICSFTDQCHVDDDLYEPSGEKIFALSFDDGPTESSEDLYAFLAENNASSKATHFMIGGNVVTAPQTVLTAVKAGGHLAVHTWTHPYMTTKSNEEVVGELGWTIQALADLNGGRIPKFWRPPYGDVDNRVRAIAKGVFGLETVLWNEDTNDWAIADEPHKYSISSVEATFDEWITGNRTEPLLLLEHELDNNTVTVFKDTYWKFAAHDWTVVNVADAFNMTWYVNSGEGNTDTVTTMSVAGTLTTASTSTTSSAASTTASGSVTGSASDTAATTAAANASSWAISNKPSLVALLGSFIASALFL
ncbi:chitin deacetylase [Cryptococcus wingfieldii CBS 7118]|uniref:chitin deacetylase n=1 Tax=Cryptococcus wingfieldii CBS 7118 TaxID=1295528 RepID=A0A1E3JWW5_9TREE|nr:chitin deacetylase [Cryptococcus wingfieldii CBS 7118]ODO05320.1 chitin deacetylase [Cryptococcus wingfieldii CBS 7118]